MLITPDFHDKICVFLILYFSSLILVMHAKDILLSGETLFRNEEVFEPGYAPEQFAYRDPQLKELARCMKPAMKGARAVNAVLYGKPATGKTTSVRLIFSQLKETTEKVIPVYVNCQINSSEYRVFSEIHKSIFGYAPPESGTPLSAVYDRIFRRVSRDKKPLIVALDDMSFSAECNKMLYSLLRAYESYPDAKTSVLAVFAKNELHKLDGKVRSIFQPSEIDFPLYTQEQIHDILKDRAATGLYPGVMPDFLLKKIAAHAYESGDLRLGIAMIKNLALKAESEASRKITELHFSVLAGTKAFSLDRDEQEILRILKNGQLDSGSLFIELNRAVKTSYSSFYRTLEKMKVRNILEISDAVAKGRGKTRIVKLKKLA